MSTEPSARRRAMVGEAASLETFRHEQTIRRWKMRGSRKPSRIVYASDFFDARVVGHPPRRGRPLLAGTWLTEAHRRLRRRSPRATDVPRGPAERRRRRVVRPAASPLPLRRPTALKRRLWSHRRTAWEEARREGHRPPAASWSRRRPRRLVRPGATTPTEAGEDDAGTTAEAEGRATRTFDDHLFPPLTAIGVGRHDAQAVLDRRSGRYPRRWTTEEVAAWAANFVGLDVLRGETAPAASTSRAQRRTAVTYVGAYCRNFLTDTLDDLAFTVLQSLYEEQREMRRRTPLYYSARRRYVCGFQETLKHLRAGRVRWILLASDVEADGALDGPPSTSGRRYGSLAEAIALLSGGGVLPYVTCMSRARLAYALWAKGKSIACVGILAAERSRPLVRAWEVYARALQDAYAAQFPK